MSNTALPSKMWQPFGNHVPGELVTERFSPLMDPTLPQYDRPDEDSFGLFTMQSYHSEIGQQDLPYNEYPQNSPGTPEDPQTFSESLNGQLSPPESLEDFISNYGEDAFLYSILPLSHNHQPDTRILVGEPFNHGHDSDTAIPHPHMSGYSIPHPTSSQDWMALPIYSETDPLHVALPPIVPAGSSIDPDVGLAVDQPTQPMSESSLSGSLTPNDPHHYSFDNDSRTWRCTYPGCVSRRTFKRECDLRKHFRYHRKHLFCREAGCPQATTGGFSTEKDRARHEAKHKPKVICTWKGCEKIFSRVDNMNDHVRRIHHKLSRGQNS